MREIKFRGKCADKSVDEWLYGDLTHDFDGKHVRIICKNKESKFFGMHIEVNPETVGQYTGLKDKTGKEIYEGDLLKCMIGPFLNGKVGAMKYQGDRFEVKFYFQGQIFNYAIGRATNCFKVVGNIIENQELLPKVLVGVDYRSFYP